MNASRGRRVEVNLYTINKAPFIYQVRIIAVCVTRKWAG